MSMAPALAARVETLLRTAYASWDGYRGLGGVVMQHFTEEQRQAERQRLATVLEDA